MSNELQKTFESQEFGKVRIIIKDGEPWFVGKDVAIALGYIDANKAISVHVDEEDKLNDKSSSSLGQRGGWLINESGLYSLIMSSKLDSAKAFKRWVTSEVLPSIRKTGGYMKEIPNFNNPAEAARAWADEYERRMLAQKENENLKEQIGDSTNWKQVRAISWLKDYFALNNVAYSQIGKKLVQISNDINIQPRKAEDSKYGTVKVYPIEAIEEFHRRVVGDDMYLNKYRKIK